jgi:hypothetical protein
MWLIINIYNKYVFSWNFNSDLEQMNLELYLLQYWRTGIIIKKCITSALDFQRPIRNWNYLHTLDDNFLFQVDFVKIEP